MIRPDMDMSPNLARGGRALSGMDREKRQAHERLGALLGGRTYKRREEPRHDYALNGLAQRNTKRGVGIRLLGSPDDIRDRKGPYHTTRHGLRVGQPVRVTGGKYGGRAARYVGSHGQDRMVIQLDDLSLPIVASHYVVAA